MDHKAQNIAVGVRIRPLNALELELGNEAIWVESHENCITEIVDGDHPGKQIFYDYVFGSGLDTQVGSMTMCRGGGSNQYIAARVR